MISDANSNTRDKYNSENQNRSPDPAAGARDALLGLSSDRDRRRKVLEEKARSTANEHNLVFHIFDKKNIYKGKLEPLKMLENKIKNIKSDKIKIFSDFNFTTNEEDNIRKLKELKGINPDDPITLDSPNDYEFVLNITDEEKSELTDDEKKKEEEKKKKKKKEEKDEEEKKKEEEEKKKEEEEKKKQEKEKKEKEEEEKENNLQENINFMFDKLFKDNKNIKLQNINYRIVKAETNDKNYDYTKLNKMISKKLVIDNNRREFLLYRNDEKVFERDPIIEKGEKDKKAKWLGQESSIGEEINAGGLTIHIPVILELRKGISRVQKKVLDPFDSCKMKRELLKEQLKYYIQMFDKNEANKEKIKTASDSIKGNKLNKNTSSAAPSNTARLPGPAAPRPAAPRPLGPRPLGPPQRQVRSGGGIYTKKSIRKINKRTKKKILK